MGEESKLSTSDRQAIELECKRLVASYAFLADHRRYDEQAALFTEDGVYRNPMTKAEGKAAVRAYLDTRPAGIATRHICGQTFFETLDADQATAVTYVTVFLGEGSDEGPNEIPNLPSMVEFRNLFRRDADGWRIASHESVGVMIVKN